MNFWELLMIGVGLSMDAFAVSICKGLSLETVKPRHALAAGVWFGGFQALMPLLGWLLGIRFQALISGVDHWIAFLLLSFLGGNMLWEARKGEACKRMDTSFGIRVMVPLALATSIDALAVGVTFAFLRVSIFPAITVIGLTTFFIAAAGTGLGSLFGNRVQSKAELLGGAVLMVMGIKILVQHLFFQ